MKIPLQNQLWMIYLMVPLAVGWMRILEAGEHRLQPEWLEWEQRADGEWAVTMPVEAGWTYFPEVSADLRSWGRLPHVAAAGSGAIAVPTGLHGDWAFMRLGMMPVVATSPESADLDGDGFSTQFEWEWGTDALADQSFPMQPGWRADGMCKLIVVDRGAEPGDFIKHTVGAAIDAASSGDLILLRGGIYHEALVPGTKSLTIASYPGERAIIDGSALLGVGIEVRGSPFSLIGITVQRFKLRSVRTYDANVLLRNVILQDSAGGIELSGGRCRLENVLIRRNRGRDPGISVIHGVHEIHHCAIIDNVATAGVSGVYVNAIYGATYKRKGIVTIQDSLIWNSGSAMQADYNSGMPNCSLTLTGNTVRDANEDGVADFRATSAGGNVVTQHSWTSLGALLPESGALALARGTIEVPMDFAGSLRRSGMIPDAGAFQRGGSIVPGWWLDTDGDGVGDLREYLLGTFSDNPDSDGDGMSDAYELGIGLNPGLTQFRVDADGDGFPNDFELRWGSSITDAMDVPRNIGPNAMGSGSLYRVCGDSAEGQSYIKSSIQEAVDAASSGDIITVEAGDYHEVLNIRGPNKEFLLHFETGARLVGNGEYAGMQVENCFRTVIHGAVISGFRIGLLVRESEADFHAFTLENNEVAMEVNTRDSGSPTFTNFIVRNNAGPGPVISAIGGRPQFDHFTVVHNGTAATSASRAAIAIEVMRGFSTRKIDARFTNSVVWNPHYGVQILPGMPAGGNSAHAHLAGCAIGDGDADGLPDCGSATYTGITILYPHIQDDGTPHPWSPLVNAAIAVPGVVPFDRHGSPRDPLAPDIGAMEYPVARPPEPCRVLLSGTGNPDDALIMLMPCHTGADYYEWDIDGDGFHETVGERIEIPLWAMDGRTVAYRAFTKDGLIGHGMTSLNDVNSNRLPDEWEIWHFGQLLRESCDDGNGDGNTHAASFELNLDPLAGGLGLIVYNR